VITSDTIALEKMRPSTFIKKIPYQSTWPIRHQVMWPNQTLEYVQLEEDEFGIHYGLFVANELTSIVSLFIENGSSVAQFRKFATLEIQQGKGYGTLLMNHLFSELQVLKIDRIWCNARVHKAA